MKNKSRKKLLKKTNPFLFWQDRSGRFSAWKAVIGFGILHGLGLLVLHLSDGPEVQQKINLFEWSQLLFTFTCGYVFFYNLLISPLEIIWRNQGWRVPASRFEYAGVSGVFYMMIFLPLSLTSLLLPVFLILYFWIPK